MYGATKVHMPNSLSLACPDCAQVARTFTYRRLKLRQDLTTLAKVAPTTTLAEWDARVIASVRTWQWRCECGLMVQVENRIDIAPDGSRGEVVETMTVSDPMAPTGQFDATVMESPNGLRDRVTDLSWMAPAGAPVGTFLDRDGAH